MPRLASLKAATSLNDVAELLDYKPSRLAYILYKQPDEAKYRTFEIPKRSGGQRTIKAPEDRLKLLQSKVSDLLQDCVDEINKDTNRKDKAAHGFKRKRSIITNARQHRHRRWVFNLDLEDFFPSINFGRVRGFLMKNRDFELYEKAATQIACYENSLPQGSPCSPVISNLIAQVLDVRLVKLASAAGCTYSRYADDLTFSTNKKEFPSTIAVPSAEEGVGLHRWIASQELQGAIERSGFRINTRKTHMQYRSSRQEVTGLVVNERISVPLDYRRHVRAMVNRLVTTGSFDITTATANSGEVVLGLRAGTPNELHGMLGFIDSVDFSNGNASQGHPEGVASRERVYRQFLFYTMLYAAERPVIICEGPTDNVYLTHAIRGLAADFPDLAQVLNGGKIELRVRLFKYPDTSTGRLLRLNGGSGELASFIGTYRTETKQFKGPGMTQPVIIV